MGKCRLGTECLRSTDDQRREQLERFDFANACLGKRLIEFVVDTAGRWFEKCLECCQQARAIGTE